MTRSQVVAILRAHDVSRPNGYGRCEHCNWARHPCDVYLLAVDWLAMDDLTERLLAMTKPGFAP